MTDFRALCEELADSVELLLDMRQSARPLLITEDRLNRARAALAEQSVVPTDEELWEAWGCFEHEPFSKGDTIMQLREFLARWGQS
jgi:hypothetical protein